MLIHLCKKPALAGFFMGLMTTNLEIHAIQLYNQ